METGKAETTMNGDSLNGDLRTRLRASLTSFRYTSSIGRGERGLMQHHIEALINHLAPFIVREKGIVPLPHDATTDLAAPPVSKVPVTL